MQDRSAYSAAVSLSPDELFLCPNGYCYILSRLNFTGTPAAGTPSSGTCLLCFVQSSGPGAQGRTTFHLRQTARSSPLARGPPVAWEPELRPVQGRLLDTHLGAELCVRCTWFKRQWPVHLQSGHSDVQPRTVSKNGSIHSPLHHRGSQDPYLAANRM